MNKRPLQLFQYAITPVREFKSAVNSHVVTLKQHLIN